ncbi:serine hydrolase domain-containing protein [Actinomadura rudentiformis]|uniref:Beta-lactamase family protein n=1 Tax=Actinomadura rudentiformis TaxID=359158 RepID=A0A6H9YXL7_9ACTN|nr:serine hydrolase domain-containing protein [Actinomadura rudentiformis]KAB2344922.1 beta-lactamase family protein [Actinomadura rudentiformis]
MQNRTRHLAVAAVVAGVLAASSGTAGATAAVDQPGDSGYSSTDLRRDLDALRAAGVVGVQGRVLTEGGSQWAAASGVADTRTGRPVPVRGRYRIGSNTKTFVAVVVLQLVAEGRLGLEDTVERWLPGVVGGNGNDGRKITVRQLLQHTSGLYDYLADIGPRDAVSFERERLRRYTPTELVAAAMRHAPTSEPWSYSNTNYILAGMIIEKVTGRPWGQEVDKRVIRPLKLTDTSVPRDEAGMPRPYARAYQQWRPGGPLTDVTVFSPTSYDSAGSMISTTADLSRFFRALLGGRLLKPAQLAEMKKTVAVSNGIATGYGLGLYQNKLSCGGVYWAHGGNSAGYISREGFSADGRRSVALSISGAAGKRVEDYQKLQAMTDQIVDDVLCDAGRPTPDQRR